MREKVTTKKLSGKLNIQSILLSKMKEAEYNPRQITDEAMEGLEGSLEKWSLLQPIVWNKRTGNIVGGHQRKRVLEKKGVKETDAVIVDVTLEEERALNIALNNEHIQGRWDYQKLSMIFKEMKPRELELTFFPEHEYSVLREGVWKPPQVDGEDMMGEGSRKKTATCPHCGEVFEL